MNFSRTIGKIAVAVAVATIVHSAGATDPATVSELSPATADAEGAQQGADEPTDADPDRLDSERGAGYVAIIVTRGGRVLINACSTSSACKSWTQRIVAEVGKAAIVEIIKGGLSSARAAFCRRYPNVRGVC